MGKIIDLSMTIDEGMQTFAAHWHPFVEITQLGRHGIENRETRKITLGTHTGTHIDAPRHFIPDGKTVEQISMEQCVGYALVLDFSHLPDFHEISREELESSVGSNSVERVIFRFDWDKHLGTNKYYSDHPFLSESACEFLVEKGCKLIALDTPQPDNPKNGRFSIKDAPNHKILLGSDILIVEYLINIKLIKSTITTLVVAPLKIASGDGAPVRCFAIEEDL
ncbi:cyclase family protein [Oceanospirillum sediminis]|uniref:Cyclase family protein n=1 Tax=Oceanospirillum sediminis TaxID=2760088 RepID=A0A839IKC3_9GAMM|nr:cyclase family protein [Oceanospirillum sediminis]MBB1485635.1 cyclase family protein [Oceanospirillum sediminis]